MNHDFVLMSQCGLYWTGRRRGWTRLLRHAHVYPNRQAVETAIARMSKQDEGWAVTLQYCTLEDLRS